jgi:hypothetical protein
VNNGGFNQLFFNGGGVWVARAAEGFERAGLYGHRDVVLDVQRPAAAEEPMRDAAHAAKTLQAFADTYDETDLGEYDDRWYELSDIYETLDQFVVDHASDIWEGQLSYFRLPGTSISSHATHDGLRVVSIRMTRMPFSGDAGDHSRTSPRFV